MSDLLASEWTLGFRCLCDACRHWVFNSNLKGRRCQRNSNSTTTGRGIDLSAVERTEHPTRDVLVTRTEGGERLFAGFGKAKANGASHGAYLISNPTSVT